MNIFTKSNRYLLPLANICLFVFFNSCKNPNSPEDNLNKISGTLVDEQGTPVPSATITIYDPVATTNNVFTHDTTNEDGKFLFTNIPTDKNNFKFKINHSDFKQYTGDVSDLRKNPAQKLLMMHLDTCKGKIDITVYRTSDSALLSGVEIRLYRNGYLNRKDTTVSGRFTFEDVCEGTYIARLYKKGCKLIYDSVKITGDNTETRSFYMEQIYSDTCCHGKIVLSFKDSTYGTFLSNVTANLYENSQKISSYTSDNNGQLTFSSLCPGDYYLYFTKDKYYGKSITVHLNCNDSVAKNITLLLQKPSDTCCTGVINLTVADARNNLISGAYVTFYKSGGSSTTGNTDNNGKIQATNICAPAVYTIRIQKSGYYLKYLNDTITTCTTNNLYIQLDKDSTCCTGIINITVADSKDIVLTGAYVSIIKSGMTTITGNTDNNGKFSTSNLCAPAVYTIRIQKSGYKLIYINDTLNSCNPSNVYLKMNTDSNCCTATIKVNVTDSQNGNALSGTSVIIYNNSKNTQTASGTTDANGSYNATGQCAPAVYTIRLAKNGYNLRYISDTLTACTDQVLNIQMSGDSCCSGKISLILKDSITGNALSGVSAILYQENIQLASSTTDNNGSVTFTGICKSSYKIHFSISNYNDKDVTYSTKCNDNISTTVKLSRKDSCCTGELSVSVVDSSNSTALDSVSISVIKAGGSTVTGLTDNNGNYSTTGMCAPAYYYIRASKDGYNVKYTTITFSICDQKSVTIQLVKK